MTEVIGAGVAKSRGDVAGFAGMLRRDRLAMVAAVFLALLLTAAAIGPLLLADAAIQINLKQRNAAPFILDNGVLYVLGADTLGRSLLARLLVGARNSLMIAGCAVVFSLVVGSMLGVVAGYLGGWTSKIILRLTDVVISFPSLLMALIILYAVGPSILNVVLVLAVTRMPVYVRTARAEVLEIRKRMFVEAAQTLGVPTPRIILKHILPIVMPTLITVGAVDFSSVILAESGLSFLGLGVQAPDFTWGSMVANGRNYLQSAWWLSFWPGLLIMTSTLSLNLLANWVRSATDPQHRWRRTTGRSARDA